MDSFALNIAGYNLCFKRDTDAPQFAPSENLSEFRSDYDENCVTITVFNKPLRGMTGEKELFTAPFIKEESEGFIVKKSDRFWSVHSVDNKKIIRIHDRETGNVESSLLFGSDSNEWQLFSTNTSICTDPFTYPLAGLILYYLTLKYGDIIIHASAVEFKGRGYLFTGVSGKGKTTMAQLWKEAGAVIIHDDLVLLSRKENGSIIAFSTPLNANKSVRKTNVDALFNIEQSTANFCTPLKGSSALTSVLSNTVQHNYDKEMINDHIEKVMGILESIPVYRMGFTPDNKAVEEILSLKVEKLRKPHTANR